MQKLINKLSEEQKDELINALWKVDQIFEDNADENDAYHETDFYTELYKLMVILKQWC